MCGSPNGANQRRLPRPACSRPRHSLSRLGEQVAIDILRCYANVYAEMFQNDVVFRFNMLSGAGIAIKADGSLM